MDLYVHIVIPFSEDFIGGFTALDSFIFFFEEKILPSKFLRKEMSRTRY
ncbi:unnamed protein product [Brassica oleracea var. botrytis]